VHAQRDLGLFAVATKRPLTNQKADHKSLIELGQLRHATSSSEKSVSPSTKT
jgi:hypothetical protein